MFVFQIWALKSFCVSGGMPGHSRPMLFLESVLFSGMPEIISMTLSLITREMLRWVKLPCPQEIDVYTVTKLIARSGSQRSCGSHTVLTSNRLWKSVHFTGSELHMD